jgi:predicted lipoprotein with Yx(FWY)xxD motif
MSKINIDPPYGSHITPQEQAILTSIQAAKGVGYRDGMKASKERIEELESMIATLDQENRQLHARNERLQKEAEDRNTLWESCKDLCIENQWLASELMEITGPVAWGWPQGSGMYDIITPEEHDKHEGKYTVPLYMYKKDEKVYTSEKSVDGNDI